MYSQNQLKATVYLNTKLKTLTIQEGLTYKNESNDTLRDLYLNDWANSFSSKTTPLAKRFAEDYYRRFHYAKEEERGYTSIKSIKTSSGDSMTWERPKHKPDIIHIPLISPLKPGESITVQLAYTVKVPADKFTRYGYNNGNFKLRYWLITPGVYDNEWQLYSHKNLDDQFVPKLTLDLDIELPKEYKVVSALNASESPMDPTYKKVHLNGNNQTDVKLYLVKNDFFETFDTDDFTVVTNIQDNELRPELKGLIIDRIGKYLTTKLGDYPLDKLVVTQEDYLKSPIYGLNQLPKFIRPFPDGFQYDLKLFKTITNTFLNNTLLLHPRKEKWVHDAIQISLMIDYVNTYYPDTKLIGSLSEVIGIRWFHLADMMFNDQYPFFFMNMQRLNLDQSLSTSIDSLVKFNKNIANPYKAGAGMAYLEDFLNDNSVQKSIKEFYNTYALKPVHSKDFKTILQKNASKDIDWFFNDYVNTNKRIDFKIKKVKKSKDSLTVTIKNKQHTQMPVSLYGLNKGKIVSKYWVEDVDSIKTITIPRDSIKRLALNYEGVIPEHNQRNNYKRVTTLLNKPLQFRLLQDAEDPRYQQFFLIPEFDYNLYDGINLGPKLYNKTILYKNFSYKIAPKFGLSSHALVGAASVYNTIQYRNQELNFIRYGFAGVRYSYAKDLYYHKFVPYLTISFRNPYLRENEGHYINLRSVTVTRDDSELIAADEPDYSVFDLRYSYYNTNFTNYFTTLFNYQVAQKFSKVSVTSKWRKLFLNNRQVEFRLYAGAFLFNDNKDSNYFSFALDRPTDYLFDYNYYGRSESSGLFSQQFIEAEGGYKSKLQPAFANQWLTTLNGSITIWNWIHAYGDIGIVKNQGNHASFLYDSGIRVSLVQDYFELFFPLYSSAGWETDQPNYDQKIRFIVSLDFNTLLRLFTRRWY